MNSPALQYRGHFDVQARSALTLVRPPERLDLDEIQADVRLVSTGTNPIGEIAEGLPTRYGNDDRRPTYSDKPATDPNGVTTGLMAREGARKPAYYAHRRAQ
ncbi:MAG: hypothetical protein ABW135_10765 [Thermoleophilaceae bacterium]